MHHAGKLIKKIPMLWNKRCTRNGHKHLTACWHDSLSWGQRDPFSAWRSLKPSKLLLLLDSQDATCSVALRGVQIKLDCGQSDFIVFAGQDFQELTLKVSGRLSPDGIIVESQPLAYSTQLRLKWPRLNKCFWYRFSHCIIDVTHSGCTFKSVLA